MTLKPADVKVGTRVVNVDAKKAEIDQYSIGTITWVFQHPNVKGRKVAVDWDGIIVNWMIDDLRVATEEDERLALEAIRK